LDLMKALTARYPAPAWALFPEVGRQTGYMGLRDEKMRWADAVAMSLYPSRGLDVHGHEIKANRGDWLRELKDPSKAEPVAAYMDFWWVVAPSTEVVKVDEVPKNWGLLILRGDVLTTKKQAVRLEPKPLDRPFIAAILRKAHEFNVAPHTELEAQERKKLEDDLRFKLSSQFAADHASIEKSLHTRIKNTEKAIDEFEKASGVRISEWHAGQIGKAVGSLMHADSVSALPDLCDAISTIQRCLDMMKEKADAIRAATKARESAG